MTFPKLQIFTVFLTIYKEGCHTDIKALLITNFTTDWHDSIVNYKKNI